MWGKGAETSGALLCTCQLLRYSAAQAPLVFADSSSAPFLLYCIVTAVAAGACEMPEADVGFRLLHAFPRKCYIHHRSRGGTGLNDRNMHGRTVFPVLQHCSTLQPAWSLPDWSTSVTACHFARACTCSGSKRGDKLHWVQLRYKNNRRQVATLILRDSCLCSAQPDLTAASFHRPSLHAKHVQFIISI